MKGGLCPLNAKTLFGAGCLLPMAKEYITNKQRAVLEYLNSVIEDMPFYGQNFINTFLRGSKDGKIAQHSPETAKAYALVLRKFFETCIYCRPNINTGKDQRERKDNQLRYLEEISLETLDHFFQGDTGAATNSKLHRLQVIRAFYSYLCSEELIGINPLIHYKPRVGWRAPTRGIYFSEETKEELFEAVMEKRGIAGGKEMEIADQCALRNGVIILLITRQGFTAADITALDVSDYDPQKHTIIKASTDETIELDGCTIRFLNEYLSDPSDYYYKEGTRSSFIPREGEQALFIGRKRVRLAERSVMYMVKKSLERAFGPDNGLTLERIRKKDV